MKKRLESLYRNLFNGKLPHNLGWAEAVELVEHLGEVQAHGNEEFSFVVNGQSVFFKKPHTHDLGVEDVSRLRKFLKEPAESAHKSGARVEEPAEPGRMIVVISSVTAGQPDISAVPFCLCIQFNHIRLKNCCGGHAQRGEKPAAKPLARNKIIGHA